MGSKAGEPHVIPLRVYFSVLGALLFLTVITVWAAQFDFGIFNAAIAMLIASTKAVLVLGYFMHLKYDDKLYWVIFGAGIFFLVVMYFFCVVDIFSRVVEPGVL